MPRAAPPTRRRSASSGRSQTGTSRLWARNMPANLVFSPSSRPAVGVQPGQRVQSPILVVRQHPAHVRRAPGPGTSTRRERPPSGRSGRSTSSRAPATPAPPGRRLASSSSQNSKVSRMVMSSGPSTRMSCRRGPSPGSAGTATGSPGGVSSALQDRDGDVPGRVAGLHVPLQADVDPAVRLRHRRPRHRQHRGERDVAVTELPSQLRIQPQRRGRRRDQLAQGDPLDLVGQALERAGHEDVANLGRLGVRSGLRVG